MTDNPDLRSINEPHTTRQAMLTPQSINEPLPVPEPPPEGSAPEHPIVIPPEEPPPDPQADAADFADPDEMEDELEQAREEGDFTPTHQARPPSKSKSKTKR